MMRAKSLIFLINDDTSVRKGVSRAITLGQLKERSTAEKTIKVHPGRVMKKARHRVGAFPSRRETKVSYGCLERERSIHLFCTLHAQIGSAFSTTTLPY